MFRKPTIADIYVDRVRTRLDDSWVPVYSPSTPNIEVGTIARFEGGALKQRGHQISFGLGGDAECIQVDLATGERLGASRKSSGEPSRTRSGLLNSRLGCAEEYRFCQEF